MEASIVSMAISIVVIILIRYALKFANKHWLRPKRLEKYLRELGFKGNPHRFFFGDMNDFDKMRLEKLSKPMEEISNDFAPRVLPYHHHIIQKYGKNSFIWFGGKPRLNIVDPVLIKEILGRPNDFEKPRPDRMAAVLVGGLFIREGEDWTKHKKIINPAFHLYQLQHMVTAINGGYEDMISKWKGLVGSSGSSEVDVWPHMQDVCYDIMSRTLFGRNYQQGLKIFQLRSENFELASKVSRLMFIPRWWNLPVKDVKRLKAVHKEIKELIKQVFMEREAEMRSGKVNMNRDLLGLMVEATWQENEQKGSGFSIEEAIDEGFLFHFIGAESTSRLFAWTLFALSKYPQWQARAREEVLQVFGHQTPTFDGLNQLKIVTMFLYEVIRLYPPTNMIHRAILKETKLGNMTLPAHIQMTIPIILMNHDSEIWGEDAKEFKPERFSQGIYNSEIQAKFQAFAAGPRKCIGQNLAMIASKMMVVTILQHYSLQLAPSYLHAPRHYFLLTPQHGMKLVLNKLK